MVSTEKIPVEYEKILDYLFKAEGGKLHYNKNEKDITNAYGIYRYAQPNATVWFHIDNVAKRLGITTPSSKWSRDIVTLVNSKIDRAEDRYQSYIFYKGYFKPALLEVIPNNCWLYAVSIFTNGPVIYYKSLRNALNIFNYATGLNTNTLPVVGKGGDDLRQALTVVYNNPALHSKFKDILIDKTKEEYTKLANSNTAKYGMYLKGWLNRVESVRNV